MATVEFFGQTFALRPKVSEYAFAKFARAAARGVDGDTAQGMSAMLTLLEKCITPEDWQRFDRTAEDNDATTEQIMAVIVGALQQTVEPATDRPTVQPSDSSDGLSSTEPKSGSSSDVKGSVLSGRPDLQLAVMRSA